MAIRFTHKRMSPGYSDHEHITHLAWVDMSTGSPSSGTRATLVDMIDNRGVSAQVGTGADAVPVGVVRPSYGQPYLRTYADGKWTNNLLNLPDF